METPEAPHDRNGDRARARASEAVCKKPTGSAAGRGTARAELLRRTASRAYATRDRRLARRGVSGHGPLRDRHSTLAHAHPPDRAHRGKVTDRRPDVTAWMPARFASSPIKSRWGYSLRRREPHGDRQRRFGLEIRAVEAGAGSQGQRDLAGRAARRAWPPGSASGGMQQRGGMRARLRSIPPDALREPSAARPTDTPRLRRGSSASRRRRQDHALHHPRPARGHAGSDRIAIMRDGGIVQLGTRGAVLAGHEYVENSSGHPRTTATLRWL